MIIAEDLLLLHLEDRSGWVTKDQQDITLAGALLIELAMAERVRITGPGEAVRQGRLVVVDHEPLGDALLDETLAFFAGHQGRKPADVLSKPAKDLRRRLLERLRGQGRVQPVEKKVLFFTTTSWVVTDAPYRESIVHVLRDVLIAGRSADPRTASLISLLAAISRTAGIVRAGTSAERRAITKRAKEISRGEWAGGAVHKAIQDAQAAAVAATMVAVSAASSAAAASCSTGGSC